MERVMIFSFSPENESDKMYEINDFLKLVKITRVAQSSTTIEIQKGKEYYEIEIKIVPYTVLTIFYEL